MKLKKLNAVLALLSTIAMIFHIGYNIFAYLTMYYNPTLKLVSAVPFIVITCIHAVLGMCLVFLFALLSRGFQEAAHIYRHHHMQLKEITL